MCKRKKDLFLAAKKNERSNIIDFLTQALWSSNANTSNSNADLLRLLMLWQGPSVLMKKVSVNERSKTVK